MTSIDKKWREHDYPVPATMRAWPLTGAGFESLGSSGLPVSVPVPKPGPRELLLRVDAVGICFSDVKLIRAGATHPRLAKDPTRPGHEVSLTVAAVGAELGSQYSRGDRFTIQADVYYEGKNLAFGYWIAGGFSEYVLAGKEVPDELEKRVAKARATESAVIRLSLTKPNYLKRSCLRCHSAPKVADVRTDRKTMAELQKTQCPVFTRKEKEVFLSHMGGVFGTRGLIKLGVLAPEVDRLLSDGQKEIMRTFACCLTPPKGLSDPVSAGQAAGGEQEIEILRAVRKVPKFLWPLARDRGLRKLDQMLVFKQPGITEAKRKAICEQVGQLYDKARAMEEADFEMEKGELAVELKGVGESETKPGDKQSRYMTALFLLIPGSREVFDNVIKRIDAADRERQP